LFIEANPQACRILGYTRDEFLAMHVEDIETDHTTEDLRALWREVGQNGPQVLSGSHRRKDGSRFPVEIRLSPFRVQDREAILAITRDVSERRRAEESLVTTSDTLSALVHASPLAVIALDREGRVTLWNPAAERIFGWSEGEVLGRTLPFVQPEREPEFHRLLARVVQGEHLSGLELRRLRKDGRPIEVSLSTAPLRDRENAVIGTMARWTTSPGGERPSMPCAR
jgi:PAS domain S-box-containing protein